MANLFSLFDQKLKAQHDLVAAAPQSLDSISDKLEDQEAIIRKIGQFERVVPLVDYDQFKNFVFFNSAYDYFTLTAEKIINDYPFDGNTEQIQSFLDDLDDYQRFALFDQWPKHAGHLKFDPTFGFAHVLVDDVGLGDLGEKTALLSPRTGSLSIDSWFVPPPAMTGTDDVMFLAQKVNGTDGYSVYFSGSRVHFRVSSGSLTGEVSSPVIPGKVSYFVFSMDRNSSPAKLNIASGSALDFPVTVSSVDFDIRGTLNLGQTRFSIGSGSLSSKLTRSLTGSVDDLRVWGRSLPLSFVTSSFNVKQNAQADLIASWRFNETGSLLNGDQKITVDHSGHRLNGNIKNYFDGLRVPDSLVPFEDPDFILTLNSPEVSSYIIEQQSSGTVYDRDNDNMITRLLPEKLFELENINETDVLTPFLFIMARNFDLIKTHIDQFVNILKVGYSPHNQTPDALLEETARFFGWEFTGNFLDMNAVQYILGRNVLHNVETNREIGTKLFEIKNEFWRRILINLMYFLKSKGTRESVESLLRTYGVNENFVRLKEYGFRPNVGFSTFRINAEKSVSALTFGSGSTTASNYVSSNEFSSVARTIETRLRFPTTSSPGLSATVPSGSIWTLNSGSSFVYQLTFERDSLGSPSGSLIFSGTDGMVSLTGANIFDDRWYNVSVVRDTLSSSLVIDVRSIDVDRINKRLFASSASLLDGSGSENFVFWLGSTGSLQSQYWMQEARVWDKSLNSVELDDHALNFQSYGTEDVSAESDVSVHWRLREAMSASSVGVISPIVDISQNDVFGSGFGFQADSNPYKKFLNDYNYIASPEFGWNEEKIRSLPQSKVLPGDAFKDNRQLALEFNMVDALNEDISQIISTMNNFDNLIGIPANRYRDTYPDLDVLRANYFKRLQGRLNFRVFADMLEFFDRSFVDIVRKLLPARAIFLGDEFVVESHMLERPKYQWPYRRAERPFEPIGIIQVFIRS